MIDAKFARFSTISKDGCKVTSGVVPLREREQSNILVSCTLAQRYPKDGELCLVRTKTNNHYLLAEFDEDNNCWFEHLESNSGDKHLDCYTSIENTLFYYSL